METAWARIAVNFYRHPRIRRLSKDGQHLYLASILHCVEFKTDGRFPADETPLLASFSRVRSSLADELFDAGLWIDHEDEVEIRDFLEWQTSAEERNARSESAKKAADARWEQERAKRNAQRNANGNAKKEGEVEKEKTPPAGFDDFWRIYPRREARGRAVKAFRQALRVVDLDTILAGARRFAENVEAREVERKFIPHPTTWLNAERWDDELPSPDEEREQEPAYT